MEEKKENNAGTPPPAAPQKVAEGTVITVKGPSALDSFINGASWCAGWLAVVLVFEAGVWAVKKIVTKDAPAEA